MESLTAAERTNGRARNIVIFSGGTGQRGGVYSDQARTNVYKLFRATRIGAYTNIDPARQLAFYDPGLGTYAPAQVFGSGLRSQFAILAARRLRNVEGEAVDLPT
jgi:uncharacterized protein (DUF2235 family)